jgi:(S)-2-hydroxyglutarate dehydrogenase
VSGPSCVVIGGGIVGLAAAHKIQAAWPGRDVTVVEKEAVVGRHQSSHNSGVLHAGLYYKPGSLKARLAVSGIRQMTRFCEAHSVPHEICGKVVVAAHETEVGRLEELFVRGQHNGLTGLTWLDPSGLRDIEPNAAGVAAVRVPEEGIVDYAAVCAALVGEIEGAGGRVMTQAGVRGLRASGRGWIVETERGELSADVIVNCAGLHADRVATLAGEVPELRIVPFRGEYYTLRPDRQHLVRNLIYPVPDPAFPFLGVHFTRMIRGGVEAGPNAVLAFAREGYTKSTIHLRDLAEALAFPGLWRFLRRYPAMAFAELRRSFSRELFAASLRRLVPDVQASDLQPGGAGVRAQAMLPNGELVQDFYFISRPNALHVLNAPSPGATASLAIGDEIVRMLGAGVGVTAEGDRLAGAEQT